MNKIMCGDPYSTPTAQHKLVQEKTQVETKVRLCSYAR